MYGISWVSVCQTTPSPPSPTHTHPPPLPPPTHTSPPPKTHTRPLCSSQLLPLFYVPLYCLYTHTHTHTEHTPLPAAGPSLSLLAGAWPTALKTGSSRQHSSAHHPHSRDPPTGTLLPPETQPPPPVAATTTTTTPQIPNGGIKIPYDVSKDAQNPGCYIYRARAGGFHLRPACGSIMGVPGSRAGPSCRHTRCQSSTPAATACPRCVYGLHSSTYRPVCQPSHSPPCRPAPPHTHR